ncbi:MAG: hypothetical protein LAT53_05590 [Idiomarina sp.]|nr:hypothetical protein [Idiomarina sp.]
MDIKKSIFSRKALHISIVTLAILAVFFVFQMLETQAATSYTSLAIVLTSFAVLFAVAQLSRKYVLGEPKPEMTSFQNGEDKFVIMAPKDRRNELFSAFFCCCFVVPFGLYSSFSSSFNPGTLFFLPFVPITFLYFSQIIPALFNSAEFSSDKLILTGVSRGKVTIPMQNLVKVERKKDWISRLRFCSEGEIVSVYAKGEDGSEEKHIIRLLKGMKNRELFVSLLKQRIEQETR